MNRSSGLAALAALGMGGWMVGPLTDLPQVQKAGTASKVQSAPPHAVALPHPEIVVLRYRPIVSGRNGELVLRAYNPSCGAKFAFTQAVNVQIRGGETHFRTIPASRPVGPLGRTGQTDLSFELAPPATQIGRAGASSLSPIGLLLSAETRGGGNPDGPRQPIFRWPVAEAYAHEPVNIRGPFEWSAGGPALTTRGGSLALMAANEVEYRLARASAGRGRPMTESADSAGDPPPASILRGGFEASTELGGLDSNLAVSANAVVVTTSSRIDFYDRNGTPLRPRGGANPIGPISTADFFQPLRQDLVSNLILPQTVRDRGWDSCAYYDTRCMYDSYRGRFWVVCLVNNRDTLQSTGDSANLIYRRNKIACAVSKSSDPRDGFWMYYWDGSPNDGLPNTDWKPSDRVDYPSIGVSPRFMMQTAQVNWLNPNDSNDTDARYAMVTLVNADALARGVPQYGWMFPRLKGPDGVALTHVSMPAMQYGAFPNNRAYMTKQHGDNILVYGFDAYFDFPRAPKMAAIAIRPAEEAKVMPQKGSADVPTPQDVKLDIAPVPMRTVARGNRIWTVLPELVSWSGAMGKHAAVRYLRMSLVNFEQGTIPTTAASGFIERTFGKRNRLDPASEVFSYGMPTLEVDQNGNAFIGYLRSGSSIFTESRLSLNYASESDVRPSLQLRAGQGTLQDSDGPYGSLDCVGASLDPDGRTVWLAIPFAFRPDAAKTRAVYRIGVNRIRL